MAISVKNLDPLNIGVPTHAPKLWKMTPTYHVDSQGRFKRARLRLRRTQVDLIDQLPPISAAWPVD